MTDQGKKLILIVVDVLCVIVAGGPKEESVTSNSRGYIGGVLSPTACAAERRHLC